MSMKHIGISNLFCLCNVKTVNPESLHYLLCYSVETDTILVDSTKHNIGRETG